ncbi:MAG TPA: NAD(P)H-dependent glycerol-3-phosphate dehydrogenase, partial [Acidimicrobiia bacterium]|nr:NAD(P)H-dependent glycerol-3-phosphate dehydrogenase [Acidimicrobiia bacterium]
ADWVLATKGWDPATLQTPSEVTTEILGGTGRFVVLGGPALAAEIVVGAPTALVAAGADLALTERVAASLRSTMVGVAVTDDVVGTQIASAYKNVVAIAVGLCEGLTDRFGQSAVIHSFANARAAVFAQGLVDMAHLAEARGGRTATILGLAGAGDLFVTSLGGRNGRFGRLLGAGQSPDRALRAIGSTVEGVANAAAALRLGDRLGLDLPTARAVDLALREQLVGEEGLVGLRELFRTAVARHAGPLPAEPIAEDAEAARPPDE